MKIGIYLHSSFKPTKGGGFSYQELLLTKLFSDARIKNKLILIIDARKERVFRESEWKYLFNADEVIFLKNHNNENKDTAKSEITITRIKSIIGRKLGLRRDFEDKDKINEESIIEEINHYKIGFIFYPEQHFILTTKIPFVINNYDLAHITLGHMPDVQKGFANREKFYTEVIHQALAVFAESYAGKEELRKYANVKPEKIKVIPMFPASFIDENVSINVKHKILKQYSLMSKSYFFYPANYWILKNHYGLLNAFKEIKKHDIKLVFVGSDKGNKVYISNLINEFELQNQVFQLGFVSNQEMNVLYKNALAMVMPTYLGPTNMPILEAMALKCPVICSDLEGHKEFGEETLSYVDPTDHQKLAELMEYHILNKGWALQKAERAFIRYKQSNNNIDYAVNKAIKELSNVYELRRCWSI